MQMSKVARRSRLVALLTVVALGLFGGCWKWWEVRHYRRTLTEIEEELANDRFGIAARKLDDLLRVRPHSDQLLYLLGLCEKERGHADAAARVWERIPTSSTFGPRAIVGRTELLVDRGRFADAEQLIQEMLKFPQVDGIVLGPVYHQQGRVDDAQRLIEARWRSLDEMGEGGSEEAINLVRLYIEIRRTIRPIDAIRAALDQAGMLAPDDDRVWLGRANLAIRTGSHDEAARLLDQCLRRRPDDTAVWRARLSWAMATSRVAEAREALKHLPATESTPAEVHKLAAWFAFKRGDIEAETQALERLIAADPADLQAVDRLVDLAVKDGQEERANRLRNKKAEVQILLARYEKLYQRNQPSRDAAELARIAEQLGRWFQAEVFLTVATAVDPDRNELRHDLARIKSRDASRDRSDVTLDAVLAPNLERNSSLGG
jgi:thioredoxin-like negative regulator of GroEL